MGVMQWSPGDGESAGADPTLEALFRQLRQIAEADASSVAWTCRGRRVDGTRYVVELEHAGVGTTLPSPWARRNTKFLLQGQPQDNVAHFAAYLSRGVKPGA
jgi:hypothetical protein